MIKGPITQYGIKCLKCGDELYSSNRRDFKWCSCESVSIDGGDECPRINGNKEDWEQISRQAYKYTKTKEELAEEELQLMLALSGLNNFKPNKEKQ